MANSTKAKIPTQNNLVNVIKAEIESANDIMKIIIESAKNCEKYEKVKSELESYNNIIKFIFGENGLLVSLNSINNFNDIKFNQGVNDLKKIISNLSDLILHISKELNDSSTVINSIDIIAFNTLYFDFISKISELFNIVNKFEFSLLLNIKLYFIIWQVKVIKYFIGEISNTFKDFSNDFKIIKSLIISGLAISLVQLLLEELSNLFNTLYNFKINFIKLFIKLISISLAIVLILKTIKDIGDHAGDIDFGNVIKSMLCITYLVVILNLLKNIFDTVKSIKIGIKFYIKLFFITIALKHIFKLIKTISEYNNVNINFRVVSSFLFLLIILKFVSIIINVVKNIKLGIFGLSRLIKKIKNLEHIVQELISFTTIVNKIKIKLSNIKNIILLNRFLKHLSIVFKCLNSIKAKQKLITKIKLIGIILQKLSVLIKKISKLKINKSLVKKGSKLDIIKDIIEKIKKIILVTAVTGVIVISAFIGLFAISLFVVSLSLLILGLNLLFKVVNKIIKSVKKGIRNILSIFTSLMLIGISMLLLAVTAPIIYKASLFIIVLMAVMILIIGAIWLAIKIMEKLALKAAKKALKTTLYIVIIAGLFVIIAAALLVFGIIGTLLTPLIGFILCGFIAIMVFTVGLNMLSNILNKLQKKILKSIIALALIIAAVALLTGIAASLLILGKIGEQIKTGNTALNILIAVGCVTGLVIAIIGLSMLLTWAMGFISLTTANLALVAIAALTILGLGYLLLKLGEIGSKIKDNNTAENVHDLLCTISKVGWRLAGLGFELIVIGAGCAVLIANSLFFSLALNIVNNVGNKLLELSETGANIVANNTAENVHDLLCTISKVGWRIAGLGAELIVISASCALVIAFIGPLLRALTLVATAGVQLIKLSEKEIDVEIVKKNINHIKTVWETYKEFTKSFKIKDLLLLHTKAYTITSTLTVSIDTIHNIVNKLNGLSNINIDVDSILTSVRSVLDFTKDLQQYINDILNDNEKSGNAFTRWRGRRQAKAKDKAAIKKFNRVEKIVLSIVNIADKLNEIKKINFDENVKKNITDSVKNVFDFVKELENKINLLLVSDNTTPELLQVLSPSAYLEMGAEMDAARAEKLNSVDKVVSSLKNVTDSLNSIQKITLNKGKIESNIDAIFKTVDDIALKIQQSIMGDKDSPIDKIFAPSTKWVYHEPEKWYQDGWWEAVPEENDTVKRLNNVDKIASVIGNVMKTIESLSKVNLDGAAKTNITNNIDNVFGYIDTIATKVHNFLTAQDTAAAELVQNDKSPAWMAAAKAKQSSFDENVERMAGTSDNISKVVGTISNVMETVKKIKDFKFNQKDVDAINLNIETLFDTTGFIIRKTQQQLDENKVEDPESITEKLEPILSGLERLNTGFESLGNVDTKNFKSNVNTFGTFVESINKVSVEKVEKTTKLFEKMSELTANMKGDFNKVAETLTEKLIPVLEDLKTIMVDVPEKLDKGFSNTSASIAAVNQPPTTQGYMAQVKREEPNISEKEAERKATERMNEKAQADSNGIAAKLDELIALFKGMGGDTAVVRTV